MKHYNKNTIPYMKGNGEVLYGIILSTQLTAFSSAQYQCYTFFGSVEQCADLFQNA